MIIRTFDRSTGTWRSHVLPADRPYTLGPTAALIPLGDHRYGGLASARLRVNGEIVLPLRVLEDRDELQLPGEVPCYVSVDDEPEVVPFPGGVGPCRCARCGAPITPGAPSVACPRCRSWSHQSESRPCWEHAPSCPTCSQPTRGGAWEPDPVAWMSGGERGDDDA